MKKDIIYFGEVEINSPQESTGGEVTIDNHQIELNLNFYDGVPEYDWVAEYENYIKDLNQHKADVEAAIRSDYESFRVIFHKIPCSINVLIYSI